MEIVAVIMGWVITFIIFTLGMNLIFRLLYFIEESIDKLFDTIRYHWFNYRNRT